ncbi:alpha/beta hydrolase, partial [Lichenihabitans sp. Uapishka_5]|nr:alpha/beta hydrolase [Lichenihabitans sp. Uapishka_5]
MTDRTPIGRRHLIAAALGLGAGALWPRAAGAAPPPEAMMLWPGTPPGGPAPTVIEATSPKGSLTGITQPRLNLHHPDRRNGTAILVMAGGGYAHLESGHESAPACRWLAGLGILAAELIYRLPADGWPSEAPFQDAQRALRVLERCF